MLLKDLETKLKEYKVMHYDMYTDEGKKMFLKDLKELLNHWPRIASHDLKSVNALLHGLDQVSGLCVKEQCPTPGSIWDQAYGVVYSVLDKVEEYTKQDIGDRAYQAEAVEIPLDAIEAYHLGFDNGIRSAIAGIEMIREGSA